MLHFPKAVLVLQPLPFPSLHSKLGYLWHLCNHSRCAVISYLLLVQLLKELDPGVVTVSEWSVIHFMWNIGIILSFNQFSVPVRTLSSDPTVS